MHYHLYYMQRALNEANLAKEKNEVPIGAVAVYKNKIIASAHNTREATLNPLHHAELIVIEKTAAILNNWRLTGVSLYVTIEPCIMCAGAMVQSRISKLIFGSDEPKMGGVKSMYKLLEDDRLNHRVEVVSGIMKEECRILIKDFFKKLRSNQS